MSREWSMAGKKDSRIIPSAWGRLVIYCLLFTVHSSLFFACSQDPALPDYQKAEELFARASYGNAIRSYAELVEHHPESPYAASAQYKVALIQNLYLKNLKRAMDAYTTLILLYPKSKEILLARQDMADIFIRTGDFRKAIGEYQWLMKNTSGVAHDNFHYQIAMTYLRLTDVRQTRIELQEILKKSPHSQIAPQVFYQVANTYYLEGDYNTAIQAYEEVVSLFPSSTYAQEAKLNKAVCFEDSGRLAEAMALYQELLKEYPNPEVVKIRIEGIETRENKNTPIALQEN